MDTAIVEFHGQPLRTMTRDGVVFVAMRPIAEALGLNWGSQYNRIKRHPILETSVFIMKTEGTRGERELTMLPISLLSGWLFGVRTSMVKPDLQALLIAYQRECFAVLDAYWRGGVAVNPRLRTIPKPERIHHDVENWRARFQEERLRLDAKWEQAGNSLEDHPFWKRLNVSKAALRGIEEYYPDTHWPTTATAFNKLTRDMLLKLLGLGMDLRYVQWGTREFTQDEEALRDVYRHASPEDRRRWREAAESMPLFDAEGARMMLDYEKRKDLISTKEYEDGIERIEKR